MVSQEGQSILAALVGMKSEEKLLPSSYHRRCSGGDSVQAEKFSYDLIMQGADYFISFGIAGGLDQRLRPGSLVIGSGVDHEGAVLMADQNWIKKVHNLLPEAHLGLVANSPHFIIHKNDKMKLYQETKALIVDMESWSLASVCMTHGKPFLILRAVADPSDFSIPMSALNGLGKDGKPQPFKVIKGLLLKPYEIPKLIELAFHNHKAHQALQKAVLTLGKEFAL